MSLNYKDIKNWDEEKEDELFKYINRGITGWMQGLGHKQVARWMRFPKVCRQLELGIGQGHHLQQRAVTSNEYFGLDISLHNLQTTKCFFPALNLVTADVHHLAFTDESFDRIIAIYLLEHLVNLDKAMREIERVLIPNGDLLVAIPSEGGWLYKLGRQLTTKRYMEKKFAMDYDAAIKSNHINDCPHTIEKIGEYFAIMKMAFLPFNFLHSYHFNAFICIWAKKQRPIFGDKYE